MRILYVITKSTMGGAQRYVFELAEAMQKDGHEVAVFCGGTGLLTEQLELIGVTVFTTPHLMRDIHIRKEIASTHELFRVIRKWRPDVVHVNSSKAGGLGALAAKLLGVKRVVFTAHGWPFHEERGVLWKTLVFLASLATVALSDVVIAVSEKDARSIPFPFAGKKIHTIHTSVPEISFRERQDARESLFDEKTITLHQHDVWLVTIAELTPNKNLTAAIDAVQRYNTEHQQQIFYTIIGNGELRESLIMYTKEAGLDRAVSLIGEVKNARAYLPAFDLFLLSSKKEGLPYVLLEAGAAGLPVIASRRGGIPEVIQHRQDGFLIDPLQPEEIVEALDLLIQNPEIRVGYADALHTKVKSDYSFEDMYKKTAHLYA